MPFLKVWLARLLWFVLGGVTVVLVAHVPAGITVAQLRRDPLQQVLRIERTPLDMPFRVEPPQNQIAPPIRLGWSFRRYVLALTKIGRDLGPTPALAPTDTATNGSTQDIRAFIGERWWRSFDLFAGAVLVGLFAGILLGCGAMTSRIIRFLALGISVGGLAIPDFLLVQIGWVATMWTWSHLNIKLWPVVGGVNVERGWLLPALVLAMVPMGYTARLTVGALEEIMREDYIRTAHAKGVPAWRVLLGHSLKNALPRILSGMSAVLSVTLSALLIVEVLCNYPGLSTWIVKTPRYDHAALFGLVFCAWFVVMDGLVASVRLWVSPFLREVGE